MYPHKIWSSHKNILFYIFMYFPIPEWIQNTHNHFFSYFTTCVTYFFSLTFFLFNCRLLHSPVPVDTVSLHRYTHKTLIINQRIFYFSIPNKQVHLVTWGKCCIKMCVVHHCHKLLAFFPWVPFQSTLHKTSLGEGDSKLFK